MQRAAAKELRDQLEVAKGLGKMEGLKLAAVQDENKRMRVCSTYYTCVDTSNI